MGINGLLGRFCYSWMGRKAKVVVRTKVDNLLPPQFLYRLLVGNDNAFLLEQSGFFNSGRSFSSTGFSLLYIAESNGFDRPGCRQAG